MLPTKTWNTRSPATPLPDREAIARIVDPSAFEGWQSLYDASIKDGRAIDYATRCADRFYRLQKDEAFEIADAILALTPEAREPVADADLVEHIAKWLHNETAHPESYPNHTWPETERDDGQREGGFVKIVPLHGQAYFRDIARRLVTQFTPRPVADAASKAWRNNLREAWSALALIRETIETLGPIGALPASEHLDGPTFMYEAEALVQGIQLMALSSPAPDADASWKEEEAAAWLMMRELHSNVPEADRPASWSDYSPEQMTRAIRAARIVYALAKHPPRAARDAERRELAEEEAAGKTATRLLDQWSEIKGAKDFAPYEETMAFLGKPNTVGWVWADEVRYERNFDAEQKRQRELAMTCITEAEEGASVAWTVLTGICDELGCAYDNEAALKAIAVMAEQARKDRDYCTAQTESDVKLINQVLALQAELTALRSTAPANTELADVSASGGSWRTSCRSRFAAIGLAMRRLKKR